MVRKGLRGDNKQRGGEIVGRERRLGLSTKFWNSLPWRPVDVDAAELGSFDDSVFHGLEEIDGNVFLSQKAAKEPQGEQEKEKETATDAAAATDDGKAKKKKNKKRAREEQTPSEETSSPAVVDAQQAVESDKKKKTKKDKKTERESAQENNNDNNNNNESNDNNNNNNDSNNSNGDNKDGKNKAKKEKKKQQKKDKKASTTTDNNNNNSAKKDSVIDHDAMAQLLSERAVWGDLSLSAPLAAALQALDFSTPTPIQRQAVPAVGEGKCDVVGVAETGSGKTLAYLLPVLNALLLDWSSAHARQSPYALIIAPTRELAMQISNVLRDISLKLRAYTDAQGEGETQQQQQQRPLDKLRIESATVVGGMSEEKQRRQLSTSDKKALHIIVATPGRLVEILEDETVESLRDLSTLRFLVVDEADRIMEEGHFAELHRVFSRIRDHEAIAATGRSVEEVLRERQRGIDVEEGPADEEEEEEDEELGEDDEEEGGVPGFERMPTEEELRIARETQPAVPYDEEEEGEEEGEDAGEEEEEEHELAEDDEEDEMMDEAMEEDEDEENEVMPYESDDEHAQSAPASHNARKQQPRPNKRSQKHKAEKQDLSSLQRQTLLFSATALQTLEKTERQQSRKQSKTKLHGTLKGLATGCSLPGSLKELLALVAVQGVIQVVDVTHDTHGAVLRESQSKEGGNKKEMLVALPKNLKQYEILCPTEDKDVYAYYFLYKNPGRTLVFVNSIKTARRVDGLLRALGFHSRALHAELAQRARLQALDSFRGSPQGILVATDVAARGLDIPQISAVLHYDVARSPQVYMHRSGRTARAHASGTAVSLVTPEDASHHEAICIHLSGQVKALDALPVDAQLLPPLRERVKLAKKIFTASFVVSQRSRERHWVQQSALEAELDLDDELREEMGGDEEQREKEATAQAKLQKERAALKALLDIPVESLVGKMGGGAPAREKPFKHNKKSKKLALEQQMKQQDWRKRRNGFFVYTPPN